jgi:hypothetical protein
MRVRAQVSGLLLVGAGVKMDGLVELYGDERGDVRGGRRPGR